MFAYAQDWTPFIKNQKSYYGENLSETTYSVSCFYWDSTLTRSNGDLMIFNSDFVLNPDVDLRACLSGMSVEDRNQYLMRVNNLIDSLLIGEGKIMYYSNTDTIEFRHLSKIGDSWLTNGVTMSCIDIRDTLIFGVQDSIKAFRILDDGLNRGEYILSKNHGFLSFYRDNWTTGPQLKLLGFELNGVKKGYTQPGFADYFHLQEGDVLHWSTSCSDQTRGSTYGYLADTLTYAFISDDSVYYEILRNEYVVRGGQIEFIREYTTSKVYLKSGPNDAYNKLPDSYFFEKETDDYYTIHQVKALSVNFDSNDTVTAMTIQRDGVVLTNCDFFILLDGGRGRSFYSTEYGLSESGSTGGCDLYQETLIASEINGKKDGETPLGLKEFENSRIKVYPNPFTDKLAIKSDLEILKVDLINIQGLPVFISDYVSEIETSDLLEGIYFLRVYTKQGLTGTYKIVK